MLKGLLQIILTVVLGFIVQSYFPTYTMLAIVAFIVGLLFKYENSFTSFSAGLLAGFLLWCAFSFTLDSENVGLLSGKLSQMFSISSQYLVYVTGLIGGLVAGFSALTGSLAHKCIF